jgi:spore coat protein U-like protein
MAKQHEPGTRRFGFCCATVASSIADGGASGRSQTVLIGGLLVAGLTQTQGRYAGTLTVTIEYN